MSGRRKKIISVAIFSILLMIVVFGVVKIVSAQVGGALGMPMGAGGRIDPAATSQPAGTETRLGNIMGWIFYYLATALGYFMDKAMALMLIVGQFNNILDMPAVTSGWAIVRDLANNFFIIILLVIAVGTILRVPVYSDWKKLLPKLLIMSALINFSKMFAGLMIDFSQIVMLTFAYKIAEMPGGGKGIMMGALGFPNFLNITVDDTKALVTSAGLGFGEMLSMLLIALVVGVVAIVVMLVITVILVFRIIIFWFLVILSPLAFLASAFPKAQAYAKRWWDEMFKYLVVGPVMLFFLYLSLTTMMNIEKVVGESSSQVIGQSEGTGNVIIPTATSTAIVNVGKMTGTAGLFKAIVVIGLLAGSLMMAQQMGVAGASVASGALSRMSKIAKAPLGWGKKLGVGAAGLAGGLAWSGVKAVGKGTGRLALGALKGTDAALLKGRGGKAIDALKSKGGVAVGALAGVAGGAKVGAAIGAIGGPLGAAIGAGLGVVVGGWLGKKISTVRKTKRNVNKSRIDAGDEGDRGEFLDDGDKKLDYKADRKEGVIYTEDQLNAKGEVIKGKEKGKKVAVEDLKKVKRRWNNDKGFYEDKEVDAASGTLKNAEYVFRDSAGKNVTFRGDLLDESGRVTTDKSKAKYKWDDDKDDYKEVVYDGATDTLVLKSIKNLQEGVPDINGQRVHRWGEYKDERGITYRRKSEEDRTYYQTGGRGEFVDKKGQATDKTEEMVAARGALGGKVKEISGPWATFMTGYLASTNKSVAAREAVENEKIEKYKKDYSGMSNAILRKLLEVEGDSGKRMAIAITLGIKNGFRVKDAGLVSKAREALGGNSLLLKKFEEAMNKRNMVMNNTRADGTIDEGAIARLVSEGQAKWADQDTKNMSPQALEVMARQLGLKFHKELDDMIKNSRDLENIKNSLKQGLDQRGFVGVDLAIRKSFGAFSGEFIKAFTKNGALNEPELARSLSQISKPEIYGKIGESDLNNGAFQEAMSNAMTMSMMQKLLKSNDISPERFQKIVGIIESESIVRGSSSRAADLLGKMKSNPAFKDYI